MIGSSACRNRDNGNDDFGRNLLAMFWSTIGFIAVRNEGNSFTVDFDICRDSALE